VSIKEKEQVLADFIFKALELAFQEAAFAHRYESIKNIGNLISSDASHWVSVSDDKMEFNHGEHNKENYDE